MRKDKQSVRLIAEKLKQIRNRPISQHQIDEFNKIMDEKEPLEKPDKRVA